MGNTNVKKEIRETDTRRSQLFAVILKGNSEKTTTTSKTEENTAFPIMKPVRRRMAVFGQDYERSKVKEENTVNVDFVYQVPKSKVIVNPHICKPATEFVTVERSIHGKDSEQVFKKLSKDIFQPLKTSRKKENEEETKSEKESSIPS